MELDPCAVHAQRRLWNGKLLCAEVRVRGDRTVVPANFQQPGDLYPVSPVSLPASPAQVGFLRGCGFVQDEFAADLRSKQQTNAPVVKGLSSGCWQGATVCVGPQEKCSSGCAQPVRGLPGSKPSRGILSAAQRQSTFWSAPQCVQAVRHWQAAG